MDVDLKLACRVTGIDVILGGHTHDGVPAAGRWSPTRGGTTLVTNAGCNGKFLGVLDLDVKRRQASRTIRYRLLPVFANLLPADRGDGAHSSQGARALRGEARRKARRHAKALLYRRGNFNGTLSTS